MLPPPTRAARLPPELSGDWPSAKQSLRDPKCCVVSVTGLRCHISTIQRYFCSDDAPDDLDLRMKVRCGDEDDAHADCSRIYNAVMQPSLSMQNAIYSDGEDDQNNEHVNNHNPCILALEELARGVASLADGPLEGTCRDVHMRVVCASNYQAIDPMFHTDKCPIRGYVTLTGPGTQYMNETCLPWEYAALRSLGERGLSGNKRRRLQMAKELDFIVMKGDQYDAPLPEDTSNSFMANDLLGKIWDRSSACVHRSPASVSSGGQMGSYSKRRVILSLDLADGIDNQEWYEIDRKRGWRSGMTQRKSRLVS